VAQGHVIDELPTKLATSSNNEKKRGKGPPCLKPAWRCCRERYGRRLRGEQHRLRRELAPDDKVAFKLTADRPDPAHRRLTNRPRGGLRCRETQGDESLSALVIPPLRPRGSNPADALAAEDRARSGKEKAHFFFFPGSDTWEGRGAPMVCWWEAGPGKAGNRPNGLPVTWGPEALQTSTRPAWSLPADDSRRSQGGGLVVCRPTGAGPPP